MAVSCDVHQNKFRAFSAESPSPQGMVEQVESLAAQAIAGKGDVASDSARWAVPSTQEPRLTAFSRL